MGISSRALWSSASAFVLLISAAVAAAPATAAPRPPVVFDALGDSYASGYGVPPYDGVCGRSSAAYAVQIDGRMRINLDDFAACAGATTDTLEAGQLAALDEDTDLVTVSIGGNDIPWQLLVGACVLGGDQQCADAATATMWTIQNVLPGLLDDTYGQIAAAAPDAHVVVTGYPRLFSPEYGAYYNASRASSRP
ncbi:MAG: SGNH/GDSL hydrolase family protein [Dermatophilaceae bacterium]